MKLFENNYIEVIHQSENKLVAGIWRNTKVLDFTDEEFKHCMLTWFEEVKKIGNVNVLADARQFEFTITPEVQLWVNDNIIGLYPQHGVSKLAFLVSPDLFSQISIEQTIDEKEQAFEVRYFDDENKAIEWAKK